MKKLFLIILLAIPYILFSQTNSELIINLPVVDYNYIDFSSKTVSNSTYPNFNVKTSDYFKSYANPSMQQSIALSASYYNLINYALLKLKINWFNNDYFNYLTESTIYTGAILIAEYLPLGDAWLHEEFHRAVLTKNYTNSYNQINDFPLFKELISVNRVTDEDLIRFKSDNPSDFVRLHAAGNEGEYMLIRQLQSQNIFNEQSSPYFVNNILWTVNSFYYVFFCHLNGAEVTTNEINAEDGENIKIRDFTGLDFTAWVYDLFKPEETYETRGIHPSGIGIDRYIAPSNLTNEEAKYLKRQGYLQLINFASPMLIGINKIPIKIKGEKAFFNFAARHLLTSFGTDISADFFLKKDKLNILSSAHFYNNNSLTLPGIEMNIIDYPISINKIKTFTSIKTMLWLQPQNLMFYDKSSAPGGLLEITLKAGKNKFFPYIMFTGKTNGWVAANVFQEKNFSTKIGVSWYLN